MPSTMLSIRANSLSIRTTLRTATVVSMAKPDSPHFVYLNLSAFSENRLHVAEMRMLRWIRGKTRNDHVRNQIHYVIVKRDCNTRG